MIKRSSKTPSALRTKPLAQAKVDAQIQTKSEVGAPKDAGATSAQQSQFESGAQFESSKARKATRVALGQVSNKKRTPLKAGTKASIQGQRNLKRSRVPLFKRAVLGVMTAVMLFSSVAPAFGQTVPDLMTPQVTMEQVVKADTFKSPLDLRLSEFQVEVGQQQTQSPEVAELAENAMSNFESAVVKILHRDASSLAMGHTPTEFGGLSDAQLDDLQGAAGDLFANMPVGALSDVLKAPLEAGLNSAGVDTANLDTTLVKDLGTLGADAAKNFAENMREDHPGVFYTTAGVAAVAGAAVAYTQGSDALTDLGIKPEFSKDFGRTEITVGAEWEARFDNPELSLHVARTFGEHQVGVGTEYMQGEFNPTLSYAFDSERLDVDAFVTLSDAPSGHVNVEYQDTDLSMFARAQFGEDVTDQLSLGSNYRIDSKSTFGTSANYNFESDSFDATVSYGYQPTENLDLQLRGGYNDVQGGFVGLGLTARF